jgi:hypothetical protein
MMSAMIHKLRTSQRARRSVFAPVSVVIVIMVRLCRQERIEIVVIDVRGAILVSF